MKNVNLIVATQPTEFPAGTVGGSWVFTIGKQGETAHFDKGTTSDTKWTFTVDDGAYWCEVSRRDAADQSILGSTARLEFAIAPDTVLVETADFLAVTISDQEIGIPA